jgi:ubiquinone/menaquinone biosynthesis C-methylase UbiE
MSEFKNSLSKWNDLMVQKYHKDGTRFEKGFYLKRKMEINILKKMIDLCKPNSNKKIADIGCGEGFLLKKILTGEKIVGIEISITALKRAKKILKTRNDINLIQGDAQKLPIPNDYFDIILCSEMLEHVPDTRIVLNEFNRILNKSGILVVCIPNEKQGQKLLDISKKFGFYKLIKGVTPSENNQNEWHLQEASAEWLKDMSKDLFFIEELINYPKIFNLRIIAVLKKL